MKKLLSILTAITLSTTIGISNIGSSCNVPVNEEKKENKIINFTNITEVTGEVTGIAIDKNSVIYVGTDKGLLWIKDSFDNTFKKTRGVTGEINKIAFAPNGDIYVGTTDGLFKSTDRVTFKNIAGKINRYVSVKTLEIASVIIIADDIYIVPIDKSLSKLYKSIDNGATFVPITGITGLVTGIAIDKNGNIYVGTDKGLWKSTDNGATFENITEKITGLVTGIAIDKNGIIYVGTFKGLWKSTDRLNFTNITGEITDWDTSLEFTSWVTGLAVAPNGDIILVTFDNDDKEPMFKSTDGINFKKLNVNFNIERNGALKAIVVDKNDWIYAVFGKDLFVGKER